MGDEPTVPITVLLIDDHQMFSDSLTRLLRDDTDIEVVGAAATGEEGLRLASTLVPKVVLVDYQLPDTDGANVAAEIRRRNADTVVLMLTGATDDRTLLAAIDAGCSGFLTKDRAADEVAAAVRAAVAGEALISPALLARLLSRLQRNSRPVGADLTEREREVLVLVAEGLANKAIAARLNLSVNTVRGYVQSILNRLDAHSKLEAVATAVRAGLIDYPTATGD
jgi:DNA-binding NarL/FixJ family response regulator